MDLGAWGCSDVRHKPHSIQVLVRLSLLYHNPTIITTPIFGCCTYALPYPARVCHGSLVPLFRLSFSIFSFFGFFLLSCRSSPLFPRLFSAPGNRSTPVQLLLLLLPRCCRRFCLMVRCCLVLGCCC